MSDLLKGIGVLTAFFGICFGISVVLEYMGWAPETSEQMAARIKAHNESIENQLPGCTIKAFAGYRGVDHLVVVICDGRRTTSQSYAYRHGKFWRSEATIVID